MNEQNSKQNIFISVIVIALIVGGGVYAWQKANLRATEQPLRQQIADLQNQITNLQKLTQPIVANSEETQEPTRPSETNITETSSSRSGWTTTVNQQLGIRFEHPADASVSSVSKRQTDDGTIINELTITPKGMDPTAVHFFSTNVSLDTAKNIQIYGGSTNGEFANATIDGHAGMRRIDHNSYNDCTKELTVAEKNGTVYGFHIVQCPTHPPGYDQLREDIGDSLKLL